MKEDNNIDREVKEMLDIVTEHGRNARRQQQLGAMMDRSAVLTRRRHWLWAVATVVMLSVVVALSLNFAKDKPIKLAATISEAEQELPQEAEKPTAEFSANDIVDEETFVAETQEVVQSLVHHPKPFAYTNPIEEEQQQPSSDETLSSETTSQTEAIESTEDVAVAEAIVNPSVETAEVEKQKNEPVANKSNPYRPKDKFTLRVGGEIDAYDWGSLPFPPITSHFALGFTLDYHFTENFSMGLGAEWFGVSTFRSFYSSWQNRLHAIPVYADLKLNFWGKKNYSPFLEAKLGYSIPLNKVTKYYPGGLYEMAENGIGIENGRGFYADYILSGPYLSLGLGCSIKHSNLSAGMVYSHVIQPGKLKESFGFDIENLINWGTNFYIRYDYTFSPFSDEGKSRLRQIKNGRLNEFIVDGFQLQLNVAGGFRPWCYSAGAVLEYKFPKRFSVGIGADFRGVNFTSREWGSVGYFENISEGQLLSVPVYGDLKVHFWENKPFSPFVEYRLGYAFALNSLTATHYDSYMYGLIYYETRHQGWYSYLGIGVTYNHSSLSLGILGQNGHHKETMWGNTNDLSGGYMGGHPFELRYSYKIGSLTKQHGSVK